MRRYSRELLPAGAPGSRRRHVRLPATALSPEASATLAGEPGPTTRLVLQLAEGEDLAVGLLWSRIHDRVREMAARALRREGHEPSIEPTDVVGEVFMRLHGGRSDARPWESRGHFFGSVARAISQLLVDRARRRQAAKRGGEVRHVPLDQVVRDGGLASIGDDPAQVEGAARSARSALDDDPAGRRGRVAALRDRADHRADRRDAWHLASHGRSRLGVCAGVAAGSAARRDLTRPVLAARLLRSGTDWRRGPDRAIWVAAETSGSTDNTIGSLNRNSVPRLRRGRTASTGSEPSRRSNPHRSVQPSSSSASSLNPFRRRICPARV